MPFNRNVHHHIVSDCSSFRLFEARSRKPTSEGLPPSQVQHRVQAANTFKAHPLSGILTGANRNDATQLLPLVDSIAPIHGVRGGPLQKPKVIYANRGYDSEPHRRKPRERGIKPVIAKRRAGHGSGLGNFAGWSSVLTHGFTVFVVFAFVLSVAPTLTKHSSNPVAPSPAGTSSDVRSSLFLKRSLIVVSFTPEPNHQIRAYLTSSVHH